MNNRRISRQSACLFATCLLLVCGSCTQSEVEEGRGLEGEEMEVQINLSVSPENAPRARSLAFTTKGTLESDSSLPATTTATTPATRAEGLSEVEESRLNNLCVVQFNSRGAQVGSPIFLPSLAEAAADGTTTLKVVIKKSPGVNTLYFLANIGDPTEAIYGKTEAAFKKMLHTATFSDAGNGWCAMVGLWKGQTTDALKVELTRAVAKINFSYSVAPGANDFSFTPTCLRLCNVPRQIQYAQTGTQPEAMEYTSYTAPDFGTAASWCWYLPENQAGTAKGEGIATSDKEKIGVGVNNATYIELTGDAVQGTYRYPGVVFRLYPGSVGTDGYNDYNVNRNTSYTINITLTGIDFADKRVTVDTIPTMAKLDTLGAKIGTTVPFRITTQPGKTWAFTLPDWLSATIGETSFTAGTEISYNHPVDVTFSTVSVNPSDDPRDTAFVVDKVKIIVIQAGLVFPPSSLPRLVLPTRGNARKLPINVSDGVGWTLERASGEESISFTPSSGTGTQDITFTGVANEGVARSAIFTLTTVDCEPGRTCDITVWQEPVMPLGSFYDTGNHLYQVAPASTEKTHNWEYAMAYCANLSADGFEKGSWKLPSANELCYMSVGNFNVYKKYPGYAMTYSKFYWSADEVSHNPAQAYRLALRGDSNLSLGQYATGKAAEAQIRCVRAVYKYA